MLDDDDGRVEETDKVVGYRAVDTHLLAAHSERTHEDKVGMHLVRHALVKYTDIIYIQSYTYKAINTNDYANDYGIPYT